MSTRSALVADAAVTVLARDGLRGLTHRGVDAEARLPNGSTSNCFRSRAALLQAVVLRLEELDRAVLTRGQQDTSAPAAIAAQLAASVKSLTSSRHVRATRARLALLLDETAGPALEEGHLRFVATLETLLESSGHHEPAVRARAVADLVEGALIHTVSVRSRRIDTDELAAAIERQLT